jgi:Fe-S cluster biosynthesis and repair protein YggX
MDINQKIAQFETMVRPGADPNNDMAWFSLGGAYAQAGRHADAAGAYQRCIEINPAMSKAYQLAGKALIDAGQAEAAAMLLEKGFVEAGKRGDRLPQKAMGELLVSLGKPVPQVAGPASASTGGSGGGGGDVTGFVCRKTGAPGTKMGRPPFKGAVGAWIHANISAETWDAWIRQGTKVINEMRLDLSRDDHAETYDQQMRDYLGIDEELLKEIRGG